MRSPSYSQTHGLAWELISKTFDQKLSFYAFPVNTNIYITFVQCWSNVEDLGPPYKCYTNVLCLLGYTSSTFRMIVLEVEQLPFRNNDFDIYSPVKVDRKVNLVWDIDERHY